MASCTLWQLAVLGSTGTPSSRSSSQKPWPLSAGLLPWRRSDAVTMAGLGALHGGLERRGRGVARRAQQQAAGKSLTVQDQGVVGWWSSCVHGFSPR